MIAPLRNVPTTVRLTVRPDVRLLDLDLVTDVTVDTDSQQHLLKLVLPVILTVPHNVITLAEENVTVSVFLDTCSIPQHKHAKDAIRNVPVVVRNLVPVSVMVTVNQITVQ